MHPQEACIKKDKRLLVLLVFGALILLGDAALPGGCRTEHPQYTWLEIRGPGAVLYRYSAPLPSAGKGEEARAGAGRIIAMEADHPLAMRLKTGENVQFPVQADEIATSQLPSPRLAFLLGRSFSINTASAEDLMRIPKIGPVLAGNILAYRDQAGLIAGPGELTAIHGIGPRLQLLLQDYVTFTAPAR